VVEALQSARRLALLTRDAARLEAETPRHRYHHWRAAVQAEARHLERLTAALGIKDAPPGGDDG
jgi:hypothetical protein